MPGTLFNKYKFYYILLPSLAVILAGCIIGICALVPPVAERNTGSTSLHRMAAFERRLDKYYRKYLDGNPIEAKRALEDAGSLLTRKKTYLQPKERANDLWLTYCRLYVLDSYLHVTEKSNSDLAKAREWYRHKLELNGASSAQAKKMAQSVNSEIWKEMISKWDKKYTDGKGPAYLRPEKLKENSKESGVVLSVKANKP